MKIEQFLTHLAVSANVAPSAQNQAMNALIFFCRKVLKHELTAKNDAIRAAKKMNMPVVMTREETSNFLSMMIGTPQLVAKLLSGSGLRISEAIRLRVQDLDFQMKTITVRSGKGNKDRITTFPTSLTPFLETHLDVRTIQALMGQKDVLTTMVYTNVLHQGGQGVSSPLDGLDDEVRS